MQRIDISRTLFLILTVIGLAFPVRRFALWFHENGLDVDALTTALTATEPSRGVTGALFIASAAALVFMIGEAVTRRDWFSLICVPLTLIFGLAVGLPAYLYLRLRPLD